MQSLLNREPQEQSIAQNNSSNASDMFVSNISDTGCRTELCLVCVAALEKLQHLSCSLNRYTEQASTECEIDIISLTRSELALIKEAKFLQM